MSKKKNKKNLKRSMMENKETKTRYYFSSVINKPLRKYDNKLRKHVIFEKSKM